MVLLLGDKKAGEIWFVAPFGGGLMNLEKTIDHIHTGGDWTYCEIDESKLRKNFSKLYLEEL